MKLRQPFVVYLWKLTKKVLLRASVWLQENHQHVEYYLQELINYKRKYSGVGSSECSRPLFDKMIEFKDISIRFGDLLLFEHLNFSVKKGECVCVCGQSGCGKSSLLKAVMGFVPLTQGQILVDGVELSEKTIETIRRNIAWIPQELMLPSEWVSEMVMMPFELRINKESGFDKEKLMLYFSKLGLDEELFTKRVNEISGGQRQRIMLAVAGLLNKTLMVVDEPTSALDPDSRDKVIEFFQYLRGLGMTILAVSHDKHFADSCSSILEI